MARQFMRWVILALIMAFPLRLAEMALAMGQKVEVPRMTKEELKPLLGNPDYIILDVRESEDWKKSKLKIQGAIREVPEKGVEPWVGKYSQDKTLILY